MKKEVSKNKYNDRTTAAIKLGIWVLFIIILIAVLSNGYSSISYQETKNQNQSETNTFKSYEEMINELLTRDYDFTFTIIKNNTYVYEGTKCSGIINGIKETNGIKEKYIINNNQVTLNDNVVPIDNLYETFDNTILNISLLFDNLKNKTISKELYEDKQAIKYLVDYSITVTTNLNSIEKINIEKDNITYELQFTILDKCSIK